MFEKLIKSLNDHEKTLKYDTELQIENSKEKSKLLTQALLDFTLLLQAAVGRPEEMKFSQAFDILTSDPEDIPFPVIKIQEDDVESFLKDIKFGDDFRTDFIERLLFNKPLIGDPTQTWKNNFLLLQQTIEALIIFYTLCATKHISTPAVERKMDVIAMQVLGFSNVIIMQLYKRGQTEDRLLNAKVAQQKKSGPNKQRTWEIIDEKKLNPDEIGWEELARQVYELLDREIQDPPKHKTIIRYAKEKFNAKS